MTSPAPSRNRTRLTSWKEIAAYLDRNVRTVVRWRKERGLPVRRVPGGKGHSVFAYVDELEKWIAGGPPPRARRWALWMTAAGVAAAATIVAFSRAALPGPVATVIARGDTLVALDDRGRERWALSIAQGIQTSLSRGRSMLAGDLDGDGERDVIVGLRTSRPHAAEIADLILRITESGDLRWTASLDDRLAFPSGEYGPPWTTADMLLLEDGGSKRIAVAAHHGTWWPGMVVVLDADGRVRERFVNSGWITGLDITRDGRHLLAAGVDNARDAAVLAVLDVDAISGTSPGDENSPFRCLACPVGHPVRYFVLPRSELNRLAGRALIDQGVDVASDGTIVVRIPQDTTNAAAEALYEFSPTFELRRASLGDIYWDWHRRVEADGKIHHTAEACPERSGLTVSSWDAENGWRIRKAPTAANPAPASR